MTKKRITRKNFTPYRDSYILKKCKNKNVLHIGACDWPYTKERLQDGRLLYKKIDEVCNKQLGLDLDKESIYLLNSKNFEKSEVIEQDMNTPGGVDFEADIIIFGETLEHLMNLGIALDSLKNMMNAETELIISVPNSTYLRHSIYALFGYEYQHPDHSVSFSYKTLSQLLAKKDLDVQEFLFTYLVSGAGALNWRGKIAHWITRPFGSMFPMLSSTLLVSASLTQKKS